MAAVLAHPPQASERPGRPRTWRHSGWFMRSVRVITIVASALFILWVARALLIALHSQWRNIPFNLDQACKDTSFSCDAASGALVPIFRWPLGVPRVLVLPAVARPPAIRESAKERPQEVVETAGAIHDEVGRPRNELCAVMMQDLRSLPTLMRLRRRQGLHEKAYWRLRPEACGFACRPQNEREAQATPATPRMRTTAKLAGIRRSCCPTVRPVPHVHGAAARTLSTPPV